MNIDEIWVIYENENGIISYINFSESYIKNSNILSRKDVIITDIVVAIYVAQCLKRCYQKIIYT